MAMKIKKDDPVVLIAGKEKGKTGTVMQVIDGQWVIVSGLNLKKHFIKRDPRSDEQGGIRQKEGRIHISNVAYLVDGKPVRIARTTVKGKPCRIAAKTRQPIDQVK